MTSSHFNLLQALVLRFLTAKGGIATPALLGLVQ